MNHIRKTHPNLVLALACISSVLATFVASSVGIALPRIGADFALDQVQLNWVLTSFVLASAVLIMPLGFLADQWGRQLMFKIGLTCLALGNLVSMMSPSGPFLIAARVFTGLGASQVFATIASVLVAAFPPQKRGFILGLNAAAVYIGLSAGPFLGGLMVQSMGWRALFGISSLLGAILAALAWWGIRDNDASPRHGSFDWAGLALSSTGITLALLGVSRLGQIPGMVMFASGLILIILFFVVENRAKNPIFPVGLFAQNKIFAFSNLASLINYSATFSVTYFLSIYLQSILGMSPMAAGLIMLSQPLVQAVFSPLTGRLSDRIPAQRLASAGMALCAAGLFILSFMGAQSQPAWIVVALLILGLGFALFASPNNNAIIGSVGREHLGVASATLATMRVFGQIASMALSLGLVSLFVGAHQTDPGAHPILDAQHWAFLISSGLCVLGIGASLFRGKTEPVKHA